MDQARARAGGDRGNKGEEAMAAAVETSRAIKGVAEGRNAPGAQRAPHAPHGKGKS